MVIWHNTVDASRIPEYVAGGQEVELWIGTYPIEGGQSVWLEITLYTVDGRELFCKMPAQWHSNSEQRGNSYWVINLGSFDPGDRIEYRVYGSKGEDLVSCNDTYAFEVG
ncbi:MAG: hypothetical protein NTU47_06425 [Ignavibacteriales bacterium]|nr:hypothetical protein [Ignavibacteriales bacterium]